MHPTILLNTCHKILLFSEFHHACDNLWKRYNMQNSSFPSKSKMNLRQSSIGGGEFKNDKTECRITIIKCEYLCQLTHASATEDSVGMLVGVGEHYKMHTGCTSTFQTYNNSKTSSTRKMSWNLDHLCYVSISNVLTTRTSASQKLPHFQLRE